MKDTKQRKFGAILSYVSILISTIIQLVYTPFLIRMLGQNEYGLYSLANSVIGYLTVLDLGFGNAIIVYTAKYRAQNDKEAERKLHGMFKIIFYVIGFIAVILGLLLYFNVELFFGNTMSDIELYKAKIMMIILTLNLGITFSFSIYSAIISAYEQFVFQKTISIFGTIMKPLVMTPLLFLGLKSIELTMVITLVNILVVTSNYLYCKLVLKMNIKYNGFDNFLFKTILGYSIWIFLGVIVDKVNWSVDQFILGAVSGTVAISIYSIASTFNQLFLNLSTAISSVFLPKMSKLVSVNSSSDELTNEWIKVGRLQQYIIFLAGSGFVLFGKKFIIFWAGENFAESYYVALFLIIPLCIPLIQNLGLSIMQAMNKFRFKSVSTAIMAIFNLLISIPLAKKFGAIGSAIGTSFALVVCNVIIINIYYYSVIKLDVIKFWKNIITMTIPFSIPIIIIITIMNLMYLNGIANLLIYGGIYTTIYFAVAYLFVMNNYEKGLVKDIFRKIGLMR